MLTDPKAPPTVEATEAPSAHVRPRAYSPAISTLYGQLDELKQKIRAGDLSQADFDLFERQVDLFVSSLNSYAVVNAQLKEEYDRLTLEGMSRRRVPEHISFDFTSASTDPTVRKGAMEAFKEHGVIVLTSAIGGARAESMSDDLLAWLRANADDIKNEQFVEHDKYTVDGRGNAIKGYRAKADYPKTLISHRTGIDRGLVDVFNIDHMMPEIGKALSDAVRSSLVHDVLKHSFENFAFENLNIYYNNGVTDTRGFHVDSYTPKAKVFLYLTDVEIEDGPYCVSLGSHRNLKLLKNNARARTMWRTRETDVLYTPEHAAVAFRGKKGDIIVSCQHAFHRGYPQQAGRTRMMGVQSVRIS